MYLCATLIKRVRAHRVMPIKECKASEHVLFVLTKFGSHCGHMQGWWPLGQSWLDVIVIEFF